MQYQQPFDQPLMPNAPYVDGNATTGQPGSIPRGGALEAPQREILNALAAASLPAIAGDLTQLAQAMSIGLWLGQMGGTANAITDALPTLATTSDGVTQYAIPALVPSMTFHGIIPATNTGPATLTLTGFGTAPGAKPIVRRDGTPVQAGDLPAGAVMSWRWDGTAFRIISMAPSDVLALQRPVAPYNGTVSGGGFYAMDLGSQQVFNLPNPASLTSGWYVDLLVTGTPSGYQTAYAQIASGGGSQNLLFRGVLHNPFYLIGGGEILRFLWTGSLFVVMVLANPSVSVNINMTNSGGAATLGGTGANQYLAINSVAGSTSLISYSSTVVALTVPVSGTYRFGASTAFIGANSSYSSATLLLADQISPTVVYDSALGNCNNAQSAFVKSTTTAFLKQGSGIVGLVNAPSSASSQPNFDTFSLALLSR